MTSPQVRFGYAREERVKEFSERCYSLIDFTKPTAEVEATISARHQWLISRARQGSLPPEEPESFRD